MEAESSKKNQPALVGLVAGIFAVAALGAIFWIIVPSVALGLLALVLGIVGRRRALKGAGRRDMAVVAIVLGLVAALGTPWAALVSESGEDYGRQCALNPSDPDC